jgi:hypothetical protein
MMINEKNKNKNLSSFIKTLLISSVRGNFNKIINIFENLLCRCYARTKPEKIELKMSKKNRQNINKDNLVYFRIFYFLLITLIITSEALDER